MIDKKARRDVRKATRGHGYAAPQPRARIKAIAESMTVVVRTEVDGDRSRSYVIETIARDGDALDRLRDELERAVRRWEASEKSRRAKDGG